MLQRPRGKSGNHNERGCPTTSNVPFPPLTISSTSKIEDELSLRYNLRTMRARTLINISLPQLFLYLSYFSTSVISPGLRASPNILFRIFRSPLTASNSSGRHSNERPLIRKSDNRSGSTHGKVRRVQSWSHRPWTTICTRCMHRRAVANQPSAEDTSIIAWKKVIRIRVATRNST